MREGPRARRLRAVPLPGGPGGGGWGVKRHIGELNLHACMAPAGRSCCAACHGSDSMRVGAPQGAGIWPRHGARGGFREGEGLACKQGEGGRAHAAAPRQARVAYPPLPTLAPCRQSCSISRCSTIARATAWRALLPFSTHTNKHFHLHLHLHPLAQALPRLTLSRQELAQLWEMLEGTAATDQGIAAFREWQVKQEGRLARTRLNLVAAFSPSVCTSIPSSLGL